MKLWYRKCVKKAQVQRNDYKQETRDLYSNLMSQIHICELPFAGLSNIFPAPNATKNTAKRIKN